MSALHEAYRQGVTAAATRFKIAFPSATDAAAKASLAPTSPSLSPTAQQNLAPPVTPQSLQAVFNNNESAKVHVSPPMKVAESLCTTCRKPRHYGACARPAKTKPAGEPIKRASISFDNAETPSTSPHYHSATSADSSLARARDGRPADEQAASGFADLFRHQGTNPMADEWANAYGALNKTAYPLTAGTEGHSMWERRGPSVNPYEEQPTKLTPPVGWGDEGGQRIERAFDQIDCAPDTSAIEGNGQPDSGPAALA